MIISFGEIIIQKTFSKHIRKKCAVFYDVTFNLKLVNKITTLVLPKTKTTLNGSSQLKINT